MFNRDKPADSLPGAAAAANQSPSANDRLLRELAIDYMHDKKIRRRWKIALFAVIGVYFFGILLLAASGSNAPNYGKPHTALVDLSGVIGTEAGVSADQINKSLRTAFKAENAKGVVLRINSPGGTPVQSAEINEEITRLRGEYPDTPMHVVVADMAASGGYFIAVAAENIYANRSSIVGSIGVRMDGFGFVDAMKKYGIERRSLTAGTNKAILDPFLPVQAEQKAHAQRMLNQVHQQFIEAVKEGRGERLVEDPDMFTGLFWAGDEAKRLGLIDDFGSLDKVARTIIGANEIVDYTVRPSFLEEFSRDFGVAVGTGIANVLGGQFKMN